MLCLLGSAGCKTVERDIPPGVYRELGTQNYIAVDERQLRVHIEGVDEKDATRNGLVFQYALWSRGEVVLVVERSAELLYGYPALNYWFGGSMILVEDPKSGLRREFRKQRDPY